MHAHLPLDEEGPVVLEDELDGILEGEDGGLPRAGDVVQQGHGGDRLAMASGAGDQDQAAPDLLQVIQPLGGQAHISQGPDGLDDAPDHHVLAARRGAHMDPVAGVPLGVHQVHLPAGVEPLDLQGGEEAGPDVLQLDVAQVLTVQALHVLSHDDHHPLPHLEVQVGGLVAGHQLEDIADAHLMSLH